VPPGDLDRRLAELTEPGYVAPPASDHTQPLTLTATGTAAHASLLRAREERLHRLCADWQPERHPELAALLRRITHQLAASEHPGQDLEVA
jgi:DNA-binding MarR family transcriptional regulator